MLPTGSIARLGLSDVRPKTLQNSRHRLETAAILFGSDETMLSDVPDKLQIGGHSGCTSRRCPTCALRMLAPHAPRASRRSPGCALKRLWKDRRTVLHLHVFRSHLLRKRPACAYLYVTDSDKQTVTNTSYKTHCRTNHPITTMLLLRHHLFLDPLLPAQWCCPPEAAYPHPPIGLSFI